VALAAVGFAVLAYVYLTLPDVRSLATTNPTRTAFMELRERQAAAEGKRLRHVHRWVPYSRISQSLKRAVLVAEDDAFWDHEGIDMEQIRRSIEINLQRGAAVRGASTLTQQLAKNLYLSPSRDPLRKLRELIIARRLEAELPKARIFEIYLNVIEWGDGIWGAEAAARTYFGVRASALSPAQSALLAGAIINPRVLNPARPSPRLVRRQRMLLARMGSVTPPPPPPVVVEPPPVEEAPSGDTLPQDEGVADPVTDELVPEPGAPVEPGTLPPTEVPVPQPFPTPDAPEPSPPPS
jgi:monofunctional biosynthetic peptidoglycan transglycosylase